MNEVGDLKFWMVKDSSGNDVFAASNAIMLVVLFDKMRELGFLGDEDELIGRLQDLPQKIARIMNEFCKRYLAEILLKKYSQLITAGFLI